VANRNRYSMRGRYGAEVMWLRSVNIPALGKTHGKVFCVQKEVTVWVVRVRTRLARSQVTSIGNSERCLPRDHEIHSSASVFSQIAAKCLNVKVPNHVLPTIVEKSVRAFGRKAAHLLLLEVRCGNRCHVRSKGVDVESWEQCQTACFTTIRGISKRSTIRTAKCLFLSFRLKWFGLQPFVF